MTTTTRTSSALALAGRALLSAMFLSAGFAKLGDVAGTMAYTALGGLPGFLAIPAIALEIGGGIAVLVGWQTRWAALALAAFSLVTAYLFHYLPAQSAEGMAQVMQTLMAWKNVSIAGGFLTLAAFGAGAWSLDARQAGRLAAA
ncbi:DoxX family protein [Amaricoccus sp.]|uniref:DoxX family protein n=1 Tax=Amaricoccus sp. TaxID=1872485 RepID=UPI001B48BEE6|nr:DoxX family protein [Amaricoccus sp.]MBP7001796.1 DoxX family protein [Amaricoccus sp.]